MKAHANPVSDVSGKRVFWRNSRGNLTITSSLVGLMLVTAVGATMDGGRLFSTHQSLQSITDSAALAAATPEHASRAKRVEIAKATIQSHAGKFAQLENIAQSIEVRGGGDQVYVSLNAEVPMLFGGVLGTDARRVSASSLAEETITSSMSAISISVVLDLSSSMSGSFDRGSKLAAVNAAVTDVFKMLETNFGGEVAAATQLSTGIYPFNWGQVDGKTVALEPGTENVIDAMSYLSLSDGSVPTTAMEQAVLDQIVDIEETGGRERFILYVTDGKVDEDKSDVAGRYLRDDQIFGAANSKKCLKLASQLLSSDIELDPETADTPGNASPLNGVVNDVVDPVLDLAVSALGNGGAASDNRAKGVRKGIRKQYLEQCQPTQPIRVAEACKMARDEGISIIAINLSGEDGVAANTTDMCVDGYHLADDKRGKSKGNKEASVELGSDMPTETLPSGMTIRLSADGESFSGDAQNLDDLREMLGSMLPDGKSTRSVRLVN